MRKLIAIILLFFVVSAHAADDLKPLAAPNSERPKLRSGTYIHFIYVADPNCGVCKDPKTIEAVRQGLDLVREQARAENKAFHSTGVSVSWDVGRGLEFLAGIARFDEVSAGRSWLNASALQYLWKQPKTIAVTPQLIVVEETIVYVDHRIGITNQLVRAERWGTGVVEWATAGARLDPVP